MPVGDPSDRANVALDIETGGFAADQRVTVVGLLPPDRHAHLIVNTGDREPRCTGIVDRVEVASGHPASLTVTDGERGLLEALAAAVFERVDRTANRLVAFNGDTWQGGFDLPFLRTRCGRLDVEWPLDGYTFTDLYPLVKKGFNTASDDESRGGNDLVTAHRRLCAPAVEFDPLADSAAAVDCYRSGNFESLVLHNLSDLHRTLDLAQLACRYAPARFFEDYKL